ncbi:MAG TPA: hypothetical protein EYQ82_08175 [Dehalococcoidia bacterium]|jgi:hypothetical protein|nr:hypothetical protein [Dehalococcoidia bacterium]
MNTRETLEREIMRRLLVTLLGITVMATVFTVGPDSISADDHEYGVTLIAIDLGSTSGSQKDAAVAETALQILSDSANDGTVALLSYSDEPGTVVGHSTSGSELKNAVSILVQRIASRAESGGSDQFAALASAFAYLSGVSAPAGSEIVLITGRMQDGSQENRDRIIGFADLFIAEGWKINAVMLPSTTNEARGFLSSIVERASGRWDDTGTLLGLDMFVHNVLEMDGDLALDLALQSGNTAVQPIEVAPESTRLSVVMVRNSTNASLDLFDPHGVQLGTTSNVATFITTPNLVVTTISSPEPGTWSLRATGDGLPVLASVEVRSPLELRLVGQPPLPAGLQAVLMAEATVDGVARRLPGSVVTATITSPEGTSAVYRLTDNGEGGDALLGDGIFSVVFDASGDQGFSEVILELGWDDYDASVKAIDSFQTEVFPTLQVQPSEGGSVEAGFEIAVGTIEVTVGEYPHPVLPAAITAIVTGPTGEPVTGSLRLIDALEDGTGWRFEVIATPSESGTQTVTAELNAEYVGRSFNTSGPIAQTLVTVNYPVLPAVLSVEPEESENSLLLPIIGGVLIGLLILSGVVLFVISRKQVMPYGYIYDDRQTLVLDLSCVRRGGIKGMVSKGVISMADAPELPVPGAVLIFKKTGLELHYDNSDGVTMRVDGRPAERIVELRDGSRIGYAGRLFEYTTTRRKARPVKPVEPASPEPAAG